jgi:hypothetical protein
MVKRADYPTLADQWRPDVTPEDLSVPILAEHRPARGLGRRATALVASAVLSVGAIAEVTGSAFDIADIALSSAPSHSGSPTDHLPRVNTPAEPSDGAVVNNNAPVIGPSTVNASNTTNGSETSVTVTNNNG